MDVTPDGNIEGEYEIHVTADIPLALRLLSYWKGEEIGVEVGGGYKNNKKNIDEVNDDNNEQEWDLIKSCCQYLVNRISCISSTNTSTATAATPTSNSQNDNNNNTCMLYSYLNVQPPDEKAGMVNHSVYTNAATAEFSE